MESHGSPYRPDRAGGTLGRLLAEHREEAAARIKSGCLQQVGTRGAASVAPHKNLNDEEIPYLYENQHANKEQTATKRQNAAQRH